VDQFGDQFDVILGQFIAPGFAHTLKRPGAQVRGPVIRHGWGAGSNSVIMAVSHGMD
jgi:hypothetical protein